MAYETDWGTGALGDWEITNGLYTRLNSYARLSSIDKNVIEINLEEAEIGDFGKFHAGEEIMIHVSSTNGTDAALLGAFFIAQIDLVDRQTLTLNVELPDINLDYYYVQALTIPHFDCLTIGKDAIISPPPYHPFKHRGGIVAFKCMDSFILDGDINLVEAGVPAERKHLLRPNSYQESAARGELDSGELAGDENLGLMLLNAGDGAAWLSVRKWIYKSGKIGNPKTYGKANCRGARDTQFKPSNITNIGGSTIFIATEKIEGFDARALAKYRSSDLPEGRGLARCYIATESDLPPDGKLYARDFIADPQRVHKLGVFDFGSGGFGNFVNPSSRLNNFAVVKGVEGCRVEYSSKNITGLAPFAEGALCLCKGSTFTVARLLRDEDNYLYLDFPPPADTSLVWTVPQFSSFFFNERYHQFNFYAACSDVCDLRGARLYADTFILAKNLIVDETTRIHSPAVIIAAQISGFSPFILQPGSLILTQ